MTRTEMVLEMSNHQMWLPDQERFIEFCHHESFRLQICIVTIIEVLLRVHDIDYG
jgi:hypothetical protein